MTENNRRAGCYAHTPKGRGRLEAEADTWSRYPGSVGSIPPAHPDRGS